MLLRVTFIEPAQVWTIDPSLLLVRVCGTIYQFICGILTLLEFRRSLKTHMFG